ncbi:MULTISPECIES: hypothetical protein [Streptacidiphilus]|uniref:Uncharacterized protein n=1 Tax=Streptacidiphilus cavernicola TaxID=3342716 RepID=A0ABV6UJQ7_9ACTN|nr:hypothetical protein [Streptacidiphilus jeojiense]
MPPSLPPGALVAASDPNSVHYGPVFYVFCGVVVIAFLIVFFAVGRFLLRRMDRRSHGGSSWNGEN